MVKNSTVNGGYFADGKPGAGAFDPVLFDEDCGEKGEAVVEGAEAGLGFDGVDELLVLPGL